MKTVIIIVLIVVFFGWLIYLAKRNQKLENEIETEKRLKDEQIAITKAYERQQSKADEIKSQEKHTEPVKESVEDNISAGNDVIASFNRMQDNKK